LVPVLAVVLCVLASVRIRRSEGTLAGASLVHWGLVLSLLVGLGYGAYRAGMYFAIKQQAQRFTERWLELLREGDMARAGLGLVPPERRAGVQEDAPDLAQEVNLLMGGGQASKQRIPLNLFRQMPLVRLLVQGGKEATFSLQGVRSLDYIRGGYRVALLYEISTPEGTFEAEVTVQSSTVQEGGYERRERQGAPRPAPPHTNPP